MPFYILPSLQHISLVKTATSLWNQENINALIVSFYSQSLFHFEIQSVWTKITEEVEKKVHYLEIPVYLKEKVRNLIRPIGIEILKWVQYHEKFLSNQTLIQSRLRNIPWTSEGIIDRNKTAKLLIQDENISTVKRYKLACMYCFEQDIKVLWHKISEDDKREFNNYELRDFGSSPKVLLNIYWTFLLTGRLEPLEFLSSTLDKDTDEFMLEFAVLLDFKEAVKYFWKKIPVVAIKKDLVRFATYAAKKQFELSDTDIDFSNGYVDIVCFLMSQMNDEQLKEAFKCCPSEILSIFLKWPLQSLFSEVAKSSIPYMSKQSYQAVFLHIVHILSSSDYNDYDYQEILGDYWELSPVHLKRYVLENQMKNCAGILFGKLLFKNDHKNISLILKDTKMEEREMILQWSASVFEDTVYKENWNILKYFILMCISSKEKMKKFKENCVLYVKIINNMRSISQKKKWIVFLQHLDSLIEDFSINYLDVS